MTGRNDAPAYWQVDILWLILAHGAQTGGIYSLMEEFCPRGSGPPSHTHAQDEAFYLLEGEITFRAGDATLQAKAGDFVTIPRGTVHSFRVDSETARLLNFYAPAGFEESVVALGTPAATRTLPPPGLPMTKSPEETLAILRRCGMAPSEEPDALRAEGKGRSARTGRREGAG